MEIIISGLQKHADSIKVLIDMFEEDPIENMPNAAHYNVDGTSVWVKGLTIDPDAVAFVDAVTAAASKVSAFVVEYNNATHEERFALRTKMMNIELDAKNAIKAATADARISVD